MLPSAERTHPMAAAVARSTFPISTGVGCSGEHGYGGQAPCGQGAANNGEDVVYEEAAQQLAQFGEHLQRILIDLQARLAEDRRQIHEGKMQVQQQLRHLASDPVEYFEPVVDQDVPPLLRHAHAAVGCAKKAKNNIHTAAGSVTDHDPTAATAPPVAPSNTFGQVGTHSSDYAGQHGHVAQPLSGGLGPSLNFRADVANVQNNFKDDGHSPRDVFGGQDEDAGQGEDTWASRWSSSDGQQAAAAEEQAAVAAEAETHRPGSPQEPVTPDEAQGAAQEQPPEDWSGQDSSPQGSDWVDSAATRILNRIQGSEAVGSQDWTPTTWASKAKGWSADYQVRSPPSYQASAKRAQPPPNPRSTQQQYQEHHEDISTLPMVKVLLSGTWEGAKNEKYVIQFQHDVKWICERSDGGDKRGFVLRWDRDKTIWWGSSYYLDVSEFQASPNSAVWYSACDVKKIRGRFFWRRVAQENQAE